MIGQNEYFRSFMKRVEEMPFNWKCQPCEDETVQKSVNALIAVWDIEAFSIFSNVCLALKTNNYNEEDFDNIQFILDMFLADISLVAKALIDHSGDDLDSNLEECTEEFFDFKLTQLVANIRFINGRDPLHGRLDVFKHSECSVLLKMLKRDEHEESDSSELDFGGSESVPLESSVESNGTESDDEYGSMEVSEDEMRSIEETLRSMEHFKLGDTVEFEKYDETHSGVITQMDGSDGMVRVTFSDGIEIRSTYICADRCTLVKHSPFTPTMFWCLLAVIGLLCSPLPWMLFN